MRESVADSAVSNVDFLRLLTVMLHQLVYLCQHCLVTLPACCILKLELNCCILVSLLDQFSVNNVKCLQMSLIPVCALQPTILLSVPCWNSLCII